MRSPMDKVDHHTRSFLISSNNFIRTTEMRLILFLVLLFGYPAINAQDIPPRPSPPRLVNDFTGILNTSETGSLEKKLVAFNDSTSTQITIAIVNSLNGYDKASYAFELGEKWGVGEKKLDNGVVVIIKPKTSRERGDVFIATGYGLEGAIPDAITKRIIDHEMIPSFKVDNYYEGLDKGTNVLMSLAAGEYSGADYNKKTSGSPLSSILPILIFLLLFILIKARAARYHSVGKNISFWAALFLMTNSGRGNSGHWNDFRSGGGSFGGGGGGGFGGFGGGSFGGGGAGGSW